MSVLDNPRKERFAQLYAKMHGSVSNAEIAKLAGYGKDNSDNTYLSSQASRLLKEKEVAFRIQEVREENASVSSEELVRETLIRFLFKTVMYKIPKHIGTQSLTQKNGKRLTNIYLKDDFSKWTDDELRLVSGLSSFGLPIFFSKEMAMDKLMDIFMNKLTPEAQENITAYFCKALNEELYMEDKDIAKFRDMTRYRRVENPEEEGVLWQDDASVDVDNQ